MTAPDIRVAQINESRLAEVATLSSGDHGGIDEGMCVMEAVAYVAGEPWSDAPACACPVITAFMVSWNDSLPSNEDRDRLLKPLIPSIVGTRSTPEVEQRRATMAADWLIRVHTPAWLRAAKLHKRYSFSLLRLLPVNPSAWRRRCAKCNAKPVWADKFDPLRQTTAQVRLRKPQILAAGLRHGVASK